MATVLSNRMGIQRQTPLLTNSRLKRISRYTVKPVSNDHLYNKIHYLWFIQSCVLMKVEGTNLLLLTVSAFWSSSRWPLGSRRQRSIPLGGRYRQVLLWQTHTINTTICIQQMNDVAKYNGHSTVAFFQFSRSAAVTIMITFVRR